MNIATTRHAGAVSARLIAALTVRVVAGAVAIILGGCVTASGPGRVGNMQSVMATLGPSSLFAGVDPGDRWLIVGSPSDNHVRMATDEGLPVVLITAGPDELILGRRIDQHLLAAPYLTWSWKMSPHPGAYHPVRIAVGFADTSRPLDPKDVTLRHLPDGVRVMEMVWNRRALRRGSLDLPNGDRPARYTVRGGPEALGKRWQEGVDLISLHDRAWPGLSTSHTRIVFVAARAVAGDWRKIGMPVPAALVSDLRLMR